MEAEMSGEKVSEIVTKAEAEKLPVTGKQYSVRVGGKPLIPSLRLAVAPGGTKSYLLNYVYGGRERRPKLGDHPSMSPEQARAKGLKWRAMIQDGIDPVKLAEDAKKLGPTAREAIESFISQHCVGKALRSWPEYQRALREYAIGPAKGIGKVCCGKFHFGNVAIAEVTRGDVQAVLDHVAEVHGPIMARRLYAHLARAFRWAASRGLIDASPIAVVEKPGKATARDRVLSDGEMRALWRASNSLDPMHRDYVRLLMLLGQRRGEVAAMEWDEIDRERRLWVIPSEKSKNGLPHIVPLPAAALAIIEAQKHVAENPYVFAATARVGAHLNCYSDIREKLQAAVRQAQLEAHPGADPKSIKPMVHWTFHDLRRSMRTGLSMLGVAPEVAERCIGHLPAGIRAVYDRWSFVNEKRAAMEAWAGHLLALTADEKKLSAVA
jgi:integrase